jgi:membrane-associated phospholipid phosphatase
MRQPFSADAFFDVFQRYNEAELPSARRPLVRLDADTPCRSDVLHVKPTRRWRSRGPQHYPAGSRGVVVGGRSSSRQVGHMRSSLCRVALLVPLLAGTSARARAQSTPAPVPTVASSAPAGFQDDWMRRELWLVAGFGVAAAAAAPADAPIARALQRPSLHRAAGLRASARLANAAGDPGALVAAAMLYGIGRVAHEPELTTVGRHATEAVVLSGAATSVLKLLVGRQRPYVEAGDADDFAPLRGYRTGLTSMPSGHTAAAFAFAAAVSSDLQRGHPAAARVAAPLLYAGATTVGLARMYTNRHWASDVVLAAGIGTAVGRGVVESAAARGRGGHGHEPARDTGLAPDRAVAGRWLGAVTVGETAAGSTYIGLHFTTP